MKVVAGKDVTVGAPFRVVGKNDKLKENSASHDGETSDKGKTGRVWGADDLVFQQTRLSQAASNIESRYPEI